MKKENKRHAPDGKTCTVPTLRPSHDLEGKRKGKAIKGKEDDLRTKKEKDRHGSDRGKMSRSLPWPTYQEVGLGGSAQVGVQHIGLQPWWSV